ncbi:MAG: transketolase C-terminal domain-containing protein, partial [Chitinophagaceae bacterium]
HSKCLLVSEEQITHSFIQSLAARIMQQCFQYLDAPVQTIGALDLPAVPMNMRLEAAMLPSEEKVKEEIEKLLKE